MVSRSGALHFSPPLLRCGGCSLMKRTPIDLEVHIKVDHLQWEPFICGICGIKRAIGQQMRDHMKIHGTTMTRFTYEDDEHADEQLKCMMIGETTDAIVPTNSSTNVSIGGGCGGGGVSGSASVTGGGSVSSIYPFRDERIFLLSKNEVIPEQRTPHHHSGGAIADQQQHCSPMSSFMAKEQRDQQAVVEIDANSSANSNQDGDAFLNYSDYANTNYNSSLSTSAISVHLSGDEAQPQIGGRPAGDVDVAVLGSQCSSSTSITTAASLISGRRRGLGRNLGTRYVCRLCGQSVLTNCVQGHVFMKHIPGDKYFCPHCSYGSKYTSTVVKNHILRRHPGMEVRVVRDGRDYNALYKSLRAKCFGEWTRRQKPKRLSAQSDLNE